jgi:transcriptional regulator with XRE-family HTH domain
MSPTPHRSLITPAAAKALARLAGTAGQTVRTERLRRRWSLRNLSDRAGVSPAHLQELEAGVPVSLETYARVTTALDLWPELVASDPRQRQRARTNDQDFVHAAMGELEAGRLRSNGFGVAMDEPYQHYQFAGRADVVAWDPDRAALLHIENRTAFPNVQEALGSYSAKRSYLADVLAQRLEIDARPWRAVTHVIVALWSAEVLHVLRLRTESFRAACPDPASLQGVVGWSRASESRGHEHAGPGRSIAGHPRTAPVRHPGRCAQSPPEISRLRGRRCAAQAVRGVLAGKTSEKRETPEGTRSLDASTHINTGQITRCSKLLRARTL